MNQIYFGDNLPILRKLPGESINLIYIDPPFNTGKHQKRTQIKTIRSDDGDRIGFSGIRYRYSSDLPTGISYNTRSLYS